MCLGKLNLDEFTFEGTGTTSCFGPVHNPWNLEHITGGSSAGSAAALAAGLCYASVGSDDGGSVRIPASFCGITGFKTSYGRVSTRGVVPSAYSLDTVGPMTRSVEDAITADVPVPDYVRALHLPLSQLRLGIPRDYFLTDSIPRLQPRLRMHFVFFVPGFATRARSCCPAFNSSRTEAMMSNCCTTRRRSFENHPSSTTPGPAVSSPSLKT